jgi:hypothetical protein
MPTVTEADVGKTVVNQAGETVGMISGFEAGTAYVDPDPGITDRIMSKLGWEDIDEDNYPLDADQVHSITDDEVVIRG